MKGESLAAGSEPKAGGFGTGGGESNYREALLRLPHCFSGFRLRPGGRLGGFVSNKSQD